ncbi:uncharacterized protein PGTG_00198 [Puccinia graminis f. sp. tritici CRL 75-36-700-3]|uniref:J domain-containing protein 1 n=1 Tax=Puccinia graminis f. sp. tritici (strain CRL 75-36-700-3 / race SCCL) TaxID=418459 RepID=E3JR89_PUCGT|nr:uncharacterized protein PGTG_00198 [Puccinia graminis f. sp. tritici CRL 75-36-700-3]EFP74242.1 hypothetical protein PGTG_00198 [Puccinia graminis f. sp. tritici CRL 75-36-700-3]
MKQKLPQPFYGPLRSTHPSYTRPHPPSGPSSPYASSSSSSSTSSFQFPSSRSPSPFEIFHLPRSASTSQIKERYYQLVKLYHPDVAGSKSNGASSLQEEEITRRFKLIRDAYELLSSPSRRQRYINFHEGWHDSRAQTPNRSWRNNHTRGYRHPDPDFNLSSVWTQFINRHRSARAGFYSSVNDDGSTNGFNTHHHQQDSPGGSYTFKQQWDRDGLFTKNGVFISAVGCISLCLYLVQLWRVLPLVGSPDHPLQPSSSSSSSEKEKHKFRAFIEPAGDARLDQEAWAKLRAIQFTPIDPHRPLIPSQHSQSPSPSPPALLDHHQNPEPNHRFYSSSFQDRIQKQNLKALSDLKSARASAVKPSVFSNRISADSAHSPPPTPATSS